jgi:hypothetical protein
VSLAVVAAVGVVVGWGVVSSLIAVCVFKVPPRPWMLLRPHRRRQEVVRLAALVEGGELTPQQAVREWQRRVGAECSRYTLKEAFGPLWQARYNRLGAEMGISRN